VTTNRPTEYANLIKTRSFEEVKPTTGGVAGFLKNAEDYLGLARHLIGGGAEPLLAFTNAYEGFHAVVQAVLEYYEVRTKDSGRNLAILRVCADPGLTSGETEAARSAHEVRNRSTYRTPYPPVSRMQAQGIVDILEKSLPLVRKLVASSFDAAPKGT
jgi:integrase